MSDLELLSYRVSTSMSEQLQTSLDAKVFPLLPLDAPPRLTPSTPIVPFSQQQATLEATSIASGLTSTLANLTSQTDELNVEVAQLVNDVNRTRGEIERYGSGFAVGTGVGRFARAVIGRLVEWCVGRLVGICKFLAHSAFG